MPCHLRAPLGCLQTILGTSCVLGLGQPQPHCMTWRLVPSLSLFPPVKWSRKVKQMTQPGSPARVENDNVMTSLP